MSSPVSMVRGLQGDVFGEEEAYVHVAEGLATLFLNRPAKQNALTKRMWALIGRLVETVDRDTTARVLVVRSTNRRAFSAGADIREFSQTRSTRDDGADYDDTTALATRGLSAAGLPTIALVSGYCVGGGCELAAACDLRLADTSAVFAITPARLGVVYPLHSTKMIVDLIGPSRTKLLLFTGARISAEEAYRFGLVDEVCQPDSLEARGYSLARSIAEMSRQSVESTKAVIRAISAGALEESDPLRAARLDAYESEDYREGIQAFLDKRSPRFSTKE